MAKTLLAELGYVLGLDTKSSTPISSARSLRACAQNFSGLLGRYRILCQGGQRACKRKQRGAHKRAQLSPVHGRSLPSQLIHSFT